MAPFGASRAGLMSVSGDAIPDSDIKHHWLHDEGSGTTLNDSEGNLDGSIQGASWETGVGTEDTFLFYDGTNDDTELPSDANSELSFFTRTGVGSAFFWMRPDSLGSEGQVFGTRVSGSNPTWEWRHDDGVLLIINRDSSGNGLWDIDITLNEGEWQSIGFRADGDGAEAYHNGELVDSDTVGNTSDTNLDSDEPVRFGTEGGARVYEGGIDRFWVSDVDNGSEDLIDWHNATKSEYE